MEVRCNMMKSVQRTDIEEVERGHEGPDVELEVSPDVSGGSRLQGALDEMADDFGVNGFKCAHPQCGLVHGHSTNKHRASDSFDMSESEAASMEGNPNCHCGLNELAYRGVSGAPSPSDANAKAPIPGSMSRHLDAMF